MEFLEFLKITFPVAGIKTWWFLPPLVAFCISFFTSMAGVSGAFLILPFQMSVLGFTTPSVSSTNFLYNLVGIPGGVYRYIREGRMCWPLTWVIVAGTLPGVLIGYLLRVRYMPAPRSFKFFVGLVLLYIGVRLARGILRKGGGRPSSTAGPLRISDVRYGLGSISFAFAGDRISFSLPAMFILAAVVGVIGGIYGIGGGAIIAPFCVSFFALPVHAVAGAALMGTFITSFAGVAVYSLIPVAGRLPAPPDWLLGVLFGLGGLFGMYLGASVQKHMPERVIKLILALVILAVAGRYIIQFFR